MIKQIIDDFKSNLIYGSVVILLMGWFGYKGFTGSRFLPDSTVQKNAGYNGPVPHSGYGVRFYHK